MKKIKILTDENKRLLAYCDFGELENGIEIEVEDDFEFTEDIENYILTEENKLKYVFNLEQAKLEKIKKLKIIRDEKISEDIEVDGAVYQIKEKDLQKFFLKKIEADINPEMKTKKEKWRLADNTYKEIDFSDILNILNAYGQRQREIFTKFGLLEYQVNNCSTVEEIETIKWE